MVFDGSCFVVKESIPSEVEHNKVHATKCKANRWSTRMGGRSFSEDYFSSIPPQLISRMPQKSTSYIVLLNPAYEA